MAILSGLEIKKQYERKRIVIEPYEEAKLNAKGNSYDVTLGDQIAILPVDESVTRLELRANLWEEAGGSEAHEYAQVLRRQAYALNNAPCPLALDPASPLQKPIIVTEASEDPDRPGAPPEWYRVGSGVADPTFLMIPGILYLGHTLEAIGSDYYIPILHGKSSLARLGLSIHLTAWFGEAGFKAQWTLEMTCVHPILLYPRMRIGQVEFETVEGMIDQYDGNYKVQHGPVGSKMHRYFKDGKPI